MKGVFDVKPDSGYDDQIAHRYNFPAHYRRIAEELVGDWIVYREPQRNRGRRAYIGVARVTRIDVDPNRSGHYYAIIDEFLSFDVLVPLATGGTYAEASLRTLADPKRVGAYLQGKAIRPLSESDFGAIVRKGLSDTLTAANALQLGLDSNHTDHETLVLLQASISEQERRIEQILINRKIRDANFRGHVCKAYDNRCAVTGLRIINGGGKAEVQAAHIWPVAEGGPDVVQNGIALSGTAHWLFDRHLISLTDDYRLLISHNRVPNELKGLFERQLDRIHLPMDTRLWPYPGYIAKHRESFIRA